MVKRVFSALGKDECAGLQICVAEVASQGEWVVKGCPHGDLACGVRDLEDFLTDLTYEVRRIRRERGVKVYKQWEEVL